MRSFYRIVAFAIIMLSVGSAQPSREAVTISIPIVVTDQNYHAILDLKQEQFELRTDDAITPLSGFSKETGPASVVLVLDTNKSMKSVLPQWGEALRGFLSHARQGDEYALVFSNKNGPVTGPFTSDLRMLSDSFSSATADGLTPLYDSIGIALDLIKQAKNARRSVLVISDGIDSHSRIKFDDLRTKALQSNASVDVMEFWTGHSYDLLETQPLGQLANLTGGIFFDDVSPKHFATYFAELDLHQRYLLVFQPAAGNPGKAPHQIQIHLIGVPSKTKSFWKHNYTE